MIEDIFRAARSVCDDAEVLLVKSESISADLKQDKIAIGSRSQGSGLIIRVIKDGRIGVSCTDNPVTWERCLSAAVASTIFADPIDWKGLPSPASLDQKPLACDDRVHPGPGLVRDLVERMKAGSETYPAEITSGSASVAVSESILANSRGIRYESKESQVHVSLEMIAGQSTGYESDTSWNLDRINPEKTGEMASFFASKGQKGEEIRTGTYDVILSPVAFSQLLDAAVVPALSGRNVHTGRSFFADKIGSSVAGAKISLVDDPFDPRGLANCAWDGEGLPVRRIPYISGGVLRSFAYDLRTAYRYHETPTASAVRTGQSGAPAIGNHNLVLEGPEMEVFKEKGLYVHDLIGAHTANPLSGDFSVELSSPFFVGDGDFQSPVRTGMISANIFDILHRIDGCSAETRTLGCMILPSVRLSGLSVIGRG
ncbi:MAG: TldD/PmbA family protein [Methanospirillum sp.]|nr:TldD/PmbA family protein [Methanospirillum sp.]